MVWQYFVLLITLGGVAALIKRYPAWLVPALVMSLALEVSREWFPDVPYLPNELGLLSFARILTYGILLGAVGDLLQSGHIWENLRSKLRSPLAMAVVLYLVVGTGSVIVSLNKGKTGVEAVRLWILFALMLAVWNYVGKRKFKYRTLWGALAGVAVLLFPLTVYQYKTGHLLFLQAHYQVGLLRQINVTFVDTNIFARFMVISAVACLILGLSAKERRIKWLYQGAFLLSVGNIGMSMSRSGILTFSLVMALLMILISWKRVGLWLLPTVGASIAYLLLNPALASRLATLREGLGALDQQRQYLIKAGLDMFQHHMVYGVGLGGYGQEFLRNYLTNYAVEGGATLSHTTVVTIAAELGILGVGALIVVIVALFWTYRQISWRSKTGGLYAAGVVGMMAAIFLSSQAEGRLLEDPMFWVFLAVLNDLGQRAEGQMEVDI
ncbi:MAG: O-antigen ligase family protein [Desulfosporosinus sp.]